MRLLDPVPLAHARVPVVICTQTQTPPPSAPVDPLRTKPSYTSNENKKGERQNPALTKTPLHITRTPPALPRARPARAVRVRVVLVPDLVEELDLVLPREERRGDAVHGCVAPALWLCGVV